MAAKAEIPAVMLSSPVRKTGSGFISLRVAVVIGLLLIGLRWWLAPKAFHPQVAADGSAAQSVECPLPQAVNAGDEPLQSTVPAGMKPFNLKEAVLEPLAGFSIDARVLSREEYSVDAGASLSPLDLALGWRGMSRSDVLSQLKISQSSRWYYYHWDDTPPLPPAEIARSSANMHLIPANAAVAKVLAGVGRDDHVRLDGWLVEATRPNGWRWRSSLTREDTGASSCEVIYVCAAVRN